MEDVKAKARARKSNFSSFELDILTAEVAQNSNYLFGKLSAAVTAAGKKRLWNEIAEKINANANTKRDGDEVRKKWTDFRSSVKKKEMTRRREMKKTGGGPCPQQLSEVEERVASLIPTCQLEGIEGGMESEYFQTSPTDSCTTMQSPPEDSVDTGNKRVPDIPVETSSSEDFIASLHSAVSTPNTAVKPPLKHTKRKTHTVAVDTVTSDDDDFHSIIKVENEKLEVLKRIARAMEERNVIEREKLELKKRRIDFESVISIDPVIKF
ncbi:myb/SANT-like DNA-binding domain-containing protein 4 [Haliotis asinina]|uniref:myb/SANT-like DNA-binding domain-containing protein 4 n=1 Tax=Haliotis asinina TaxID=109174 RepID=UPI0035326345